MRVSIVVVKGGLGNQMFGYAFFLALKDTQRFSFILIDIEETVNKHFGIEIFKIFQCKGSWRYNIFCLLHKIKPYFWKNYINVKQNNSLNYDEQILQHYKSNVYFDGYWQSEKYFYNVSKTIRKQFRFRDSLFNNSTKKIAESLKATNSVSIHVRRGDYLFETGWNTCDLNYYLQAIEYIKQQQKDLVFYVFSDDIVWCEKVFNNDKFIFIDWNTGKDSWQDMYLMSICKHNIIANSTFSWWGAWLNNNPSKIVIAPKVWFRDRDMSECHIIPDNWIKL